MTDLDRGVSAPAEPRPRVFIHTNERQWIGALVSRHSLLRNSAHAERFDVEFLRTEDHPVLRARDGQLYLREGERVPWRYEDLQSFTPLRFAPPEKMGWRGRALVIDPDVFAVGDVFELLARDLRGHALSCRLRSGSKGLAGGMASSVMLLDCARLGHWRWEQQFGELFSFERDYMKWILLQYEPRESIVLLEDEWNDFDRLTPKTRMLHNTKRQTQPWKTGLPADYTPARKRLKPLNPATWVRPFTRRRAPAVYSAHPDPNQERFFFGLLRECLESGVVTEALLRDEMRRNHIRHDALEVIERTPTLAA
ncbi:MAG TPA: hypothetical protein VLC53_07510 [Myxococcota bacterium]|nr:hypothetical protein [Myxococcota bacterium]